MRPITDGYFLSCSKDPRGFALFHSKDRLCSLERDSGNTKYPYSALSKVNPAATKNGTRRPYSANKPPTDGPIINPSPKAAPNNPKFWALVLGVLTSAI